MFHAIYVGSISACFELDNRAPFYSPAPYRVLLDGQDALEGTENVFSLFRLEPDREYSVTLRMGDAEASLTIHTRPEACAVSVRAFGAVGDGATDDTAALQRAILSLPEGGRLVFPAGTYLTGPILLKSHMTLELQAGATLLGLTDKAAYPVLPATAEDLDGGNRVHFGTFEGLARDMYAALITAEYARDIAIVGPGRVDGNAQNGDWWQTFKAGPRGAAQAHLPEPLRKRDAARCGCRQLRLLAAASLFQQRRGLLRRLGLRAQGQPQHRRAGPGVLRRRGHRGLPLLGGRRLHRHQVRQAGAAQDVPRRRPAATPSATA